MIRHVPWFLRQVLSRLGPHARVKSSSIVSAPVRCSESEKTAGSPAIRKAEESGELDAGAGSRAAGSGLVAAAFASLKDGGRVAPGPVARKRSLVEAQIAKADSVEAILTVAELPTLSRHHALRIISVLSDWSASGRVKLADFEGDVRFVKLCRILGKSAHGPRAGPGGFGDLATVLGVTGDDEAAKLVAGISLPQMIKVMSTLAQKRRRSTPLLRSLAFNIGRQDERLDAKQCADLLYAAAVLSFPDDVLMEKVCADLCESAPANTRSAVVRSVATSLGLMRYKHTEVLDVLSEWAATNADSCRPQDLSSLVLTLATVNHTPFNADVLFDAVEKHVVPDTLPSPVAWLEFAWSLFVLNRGSAQLAETVLRQEFLDKLAAGKGEIQGIPTASKLKLLNINACVQLELPQYSGPLLVADSEIHDVPLVRSQEKTALLAAIFDSMANLLSSSTYLRRDINTGMGFLLDGECLLDANCNPLPVEGIDSSSSEKSSNKKKTKIGIVALGYHDLCRGAPGEQSGFSALAARLLCGKGYKVLAVPHTDFSPHEKLVRRVQYLDQQLRSTVRDS
ncbi:FAST kinase domain-containing protein 4 [Bacillus rossius redtenbacheri]|uniref:FAST kinase domain-containing protein 4 n=1 Tax=Bacillus rossius redtenbacheri TaxID=93214 RepID=UPI002FDE2CBF